MSSRVLAKGVEVLGKDVVCTWSKENNHSHRSLSIIDNEDDIPKLVDKILHDPKNLLFRFGTSTIRK